MAATCDTPEDDRRVGELIVAARAGSAEALGELLEAFRPYLLCIAVEQIPAALGGKCAPSDVVQETLFHVCRKFAKFQGCSEEELRAWLRRILLNELANACKHYRARKRAGMRERPLEADIVDRHDTAPDATVLAAEAAGLVSEVLEDLPRRYRQVIALRNRDGCSFAEIGRAMDRTEESARKLWVRAVAHLQGMLQADGTA